MNKNKIDVDVKNLQTLVDISNLKNQSMTDLINYIIDQYILYFNDLVKSTPEYQIKPRTPVRPTKPLMSFKEFIRSTKSQKN
jgi:hypothetical protein